MKKLLHKLRSRSGESIAETLVAVLIAAVAMLMLAQMISTSANLIERSKSRMQVYYEANDRLNTRDSVALADGSSYSVTIVEAGDEDGKISQSFSDVKVYENDTISQTPVRAYTK